MLHDFAAPVLRLTDGMRMHYIPVPDEMAEALRASGTRRVIGTINAQPIDRALHGNAQDGWRLMLGRAVLRDLGVQYGDTVIVALRSDPAPDTVDVPEELAEALAQDEAAAARFESMTPGRQRGLAYYVDSAKQPATRVKRALELTYKLRTYTLYADQNR